MSGKIILTEIEKARFNAEVAKKLIVKDYDQFKDYMKLFFFSYGSNIFYFDGVVFRLKTINEIKQQLPIDLSHTVKIANPETEKFEKVTLSARNYIETIDFTKDIFTPTIDFSTSDRVIDKITMIKGLKFNDKALNMAKPFTIDVFNRPKAYRAGTKTKVTLIYDHLLNIINSGDKDANEYFLNWVSCTLNGRKLRKAIHMISGEGTGKGLIVGGLFKNIMGDALFKTSSTESITKYTKNFEGCALINFDELPAADNKKEISDCLKSLITEGTFACRDMFKTAYEQKNTFNSITTSNNNTSVCLTQTNKRRWHIPDISAEKVGDIEYFAKLANAVNDVAVYTKFYWEMVDRFQTLKNWNEDIMPVTNSFKTNIIASLPRFYLYIKDAYVLDSKSMEIKPSELCADYLVVNKLERQTSKQLIIKLKKDLGFETKKIKGIHHFKYSNKQLMKMFRDKDWIDDEFDEIDDDRETTTKYYGDVDSDDEEPKLTVKRIRKKPKDVSMESDDESDLEEDNDGNIINKAVKSNDETDESDNEPDELDEYDNEDQATEMTADDSKQLFACFDDTDDDSDDDSDDEKKEN